jgi:probable phosphoglycerate mutase
MWYDPVMTMLCLIRHGENEYTRTGRLAGWTDGVCLNEAGRAQAQQLALRLAHAPLAAVYTSPLARCRETAEIVIGRNHPHLTPVPVPEVGEVRIGEWEGALLDDLRRLPAWKTVQQTPSRFTFPGGESFEAVQQRAVAAVEAIAARYPQELVAIVSHADVIKLLVARFIGLPLDCFQQIAIATASVTMVTISADSPPLLVCLNDTGTPPWSSPPPSGDPPSGGPPPGARECPITLNSTLSPT